MLVTKERYVFIIQHNFKQRTIQVQAQFRFAFPQRPPPSKIAIQTEQQVQQVLNPLHHKADAILI